MLVGPPPRGVAAPEVSRLPALLGPQEACAASGSPPRRGGWPLGRTGREAAQGSGSSTPGLPSQASPAGAPGGGSAQREDGSETSSSIF